jgi:hypothetical protein
MIASEMRVGARWAIGGPKAAGETLIAVFTRKSAIK